MGEGSPLFLGNLDLKICRYLTLGAGWWVVKWLLSQGAGSLRETWLVSQIWSYSSLFSECISYFSSPAFNNAVYEWPSLFTALQKSIEALCVYGLAEEFQALLHKHTLEYLMSTFLDGWGGMLPTVHSDRLVLNENWLWLIFRQDNEEVLMEYVTSTPLRLPSAYDNIRF